MSPEEYAHKIGRLASECFEETGFWIDVEDGAIVLKKWIDEEGRYEVVEIYP